MDENKYKWWQKTVVYQIYPRSFKDSTGNGIGDIRGIIEKLDYIQDLGVETIWISPFFESPQTDYGYDISNFREIAPEYGDMNDFNILLKEIHDRNMKIVLDLVLHGLKNLLQIKIIPSGTGISGGTEKNQREGSPQIIGRQFREG